MILQTQTDTLIKALAELNRRIVSDWRTLIILRRATFTLSDHERRWERLPDTKQDVHRLLSQLARRGELTPLTIAPYVFRVTSPYALVLPISEEEILLEVNPYAVISHASALVRHNLSLDVPNRLWATTPLYPTSDLVPLDTVLEDWEGIERPVVRRPSAIQGTPVEWTVTKSTEGLFGIATVRPHGVPYFITSVERTLLDGLVAPEKCHGAQNVLSAWKNAADQESIDLPTMVNLVDRFKIGLLAQRAGYLLEALGYSHPDFDRWAASAHRGGSSKLIAGNEYSEQFSERWKLSLNGPISLLSRDN